MRKMSGQRSDWRERLGVNPSRMEQELAIKLQDDGIRYQTQVEIPVTTADFYFPLETRPLVVFVDGRVHLGTAQMAKDEELRTILRKKDTESWSYATTATRTRKETVFTKKFGAASPSWLASHQILRQTERPDTHPRRSNIVALPYVRGCVEESRPDAHVSHAAFPSIGMFSRQVASRFPKPSLPIRRKTHPNTGHSRMKILRGIR